MGFDLRITGTGDLQKGLDGWLERMRAGTQEALEDSATYLQGAVQEKLSHPGTYRSPGARPGAPLTSEPGTPPAKQSGTLRSRVLKRVDGLIEAGVYRAKVFPSTVYARIQELGGVTGAGHRTRLPARPYLEPAVEESKARIRDIFTSTWQRATKG